MPNFYFVAIAFFIFAGGIYLIIRLAMKGSSELLTKKKKRWEPK